MASRADCNCCSFSETLERSLLEAITVGVFWLDAISLAVIPIFELLYSVLAACVFLFVSAFPVATLATSFGAATTLNFFSSDTLSTAFSLFLFFLFFLFVFFVSSLNALRRSIPPPLASVHETLSFPHTSFTTGPNTDFPFSEREPRPTITLNRPFSGLRFSTRF